MRNGSEISQKNDPILKPIGRNFGYMAPKSNYSVDGRFIRIKW